MDYVPYAVPFFLLAILIELAYGIIKKNNTYRLNDAISSIFMGSLRSAWSHEVDIRAFSDTPWWNH